MRQAVEGGVCNFNITVFSSEFYEGIGALVWLSAGMAGLPAREGGYRRKCATPPLKMKDLTLHALSLCDVQWALPHLCRSSRYMYIAPRDLPSLQRGMKLVVCAIS